MFNLQDAMAGSQLDSLLALLGRILVNEAVLLDSELDGLIHDLFPTASLGVKLGLKTSIRLQKESVAPPGMSPGMSSLGVLF